MNGQIKICDFRVSFATENNCISYPHKRKNARIWRHKLLDKTETDLTFYYDFMSLMRRIAKL